MKLSILTSMSIREGKRIVLISDINQVQEVEEYEEATEDIYPVEPELQEKSSSA